MQRQGITAQIRRRLFSGCNIKERIRGWVRSLGLRYIIRISAFDGFPKTSRPAYTDKALFRFQNEVSIRNQSTFININFGIQGHLIIFIAGIRINTHLQEIPSKPNQQCLSISYETPEEVSICWNKQSQRRFGFTFAYCQIFFSYIDCRSFFLFLWWKWYGE